MTTRLVVAIVVFVAVVTSVIVAPAFALPPIPPPEQVVPAGTTIDPTVIVGAVTAILSGSIVYAGIAWRKAGPEIDQIVERTYRFTNDELRKSMSAMRQDYERQLDSMREDYERQIRSRDEEIARVRERCSRCEEVLRKAGLA